MRRVCLIPALVALLLSTAASAQGWQEYVNRENNFQINFPAEPTVTETQYRTVKGTMLPAKVFTAAAPQGSIFAGTYKVTIVDYSNALNEIPDAIEQAREAIKAKGAVKYDEVNDLDRHREWRLTVETPTTRILASTLITATNKLFITEGENALNLPPPGQFHVSLQILNEIMGNAPAGRLHKALVETGKAAAVFQASLQISVPVSHAASSEAR